MTIQAADNEDLYDHVLGSGALIYSWWEDYKDILPAGEYQDWEVELAVENPHEDGSIRFTVTPAKIRTAMRYVLANKGKTRKSARGSEYRVWSRTLEQECSNLTFRADEADLDAPCADELLQIVAFGEVHFG